MQQETNTRAALPIAHLKGKNDPPADETSSDQEINLLFHKLKSMEPELIRRLLKSCAAMLLQEHQQGSGYQAEKERFLVKTGRHLTSIHINQVAFFYCENKTVYLKTKDDRNHILKASIEEIEHTVSPRDFFRISRQIIVSRSSIKKIVIWFNGTLRIDLAPGDHANIIISKLRAPQFRQWLGE